MYGEFNYTIRFNLDSPSTGLNGQITILILMALAEVVSLLGNDCEQNLFVFNTS